MSGINHIIDSRIRHLRRVQVLSLAALSEQSGVSRSNISLIERGESGVTATVLDQLGAALGVNAVSLFEQATVTPVPVSRVEDQPVWTDPASGYVHRNLSPRIDSLLQLVKVCFPPGQRVAYKLTVRDVGVQQQMWLIEGAMEVTVSESDYMLSNGDCLAMRLDHPIA